MRQECERCKELEDTIETLRTTLLRQTKMHHVALELEGKYSTELVREVVELKRALEQRGGRT